MPTSARRTRVPLRGDRLYGLPLPSPRIGVGSVLGLAGTGRLRHLVALFQGPPVPDRLEIAEFDAYVARATTAQEQP